MQKLSSFFTQPLKKITTLLIIVCALVLIFPPVFADELENKIEDEAAKDNQVDDLNKDIREKSGKIEELSTKLHTYEQQILEKQNDEANLKNQIEVIDTTIEETGVKIEKSETELDVTQTEIEVVQRQIKESEANITKNKESLGNLIQEIHKNEQKTPIEIAFAQPTFSDFYSQLEYTSQVQNDVHSTVDRVQKIKHELKDRKQELKKKKAEVALHKTNLENERVDLQEEQQYKDRLLTDTQESEEKFQDLLNRARAEHAEVEAEVAQLTKEAQNRINDIRQDIENNLDQEEEQENAQEDKDNPAPDNGQEDVPVSNGPIQFQWPLTNVYITCEFHCAGYPFANVLGPHSGIDMRASMGTPIYAAASGYVSRILFDPNSSKFGAIYITHGEGLLSMYGHISRYNVEPNTYVRRGDLIGWTGGMPGTAGSGTSTAPHLHFEMRLNGFAVDPKNYLP